MTVVFNASHGAEVVEPIQDTDRLYCAACKGRGTVLEEADHFITRRVPCWKCKTQRLVHEPEIEPASPDDLIEVADKICEVRNLEAGIPPIAYRDEARIGQAKCAKIRAQLGMDMMTENHFDAFTLGFMHGPWRAMKRRLFYKGRAEYERAQAVLRMLAGGREDFSTRGGV